MTEQTELLPCPFCGSSRIVDINIGERCTCSDCGATVYGIDQWNTRPAPAVAVKPLEWRDYDGNVSGVVLACSSIGTYFIERELTWYKLTLGSDPVSEAWSVRWLKEDAERDHERRILSALSPQPPVTPEQAARDEIWNEAIEDAAELASEWQERIGEEIRGLKK